MNVIIVEDELPAFNRLKKILLQVEPKINIVAHADSIEQAVTLIKQHNDIVLGLFDIELADGQSFEIFNQTDVPFPVIFTTAYDEFALKAFKINSIDYLLKPVDVDELKAAIEKFKLHYNKPDTRNQIEQLLIDLNLEANHKTKSRFLVKMGDRLISVQTKDIAYFYSKDKFTYLVTHKNNRYIIDYTLDQLNKMLESAMFFQLNRQVIAQFDSIKQVSNYFNGKLKITISPDFDTEIIVSRERAPELKNWLDQ